VRLTLSRVIGDLLKVDLENWFTYNKEPPIVLAAGAVPVIKDWGSSVSDNEIFTMNDLEDFQTTGSVKIEVGRPKDLVIDTTSLQEIIPQVRFNNFYTHFRVLKNAASPIFILLRFYSRCLH